MTDEEILSKFRWHGYHLPENCEERMGEHFFTEYAFVQSPRRGLREIYFTCCGERMTFLRGMPADYYRDNYQRELETARHNDMALCPICGAPVPEGRMVCWACEHPNSCGLCKWWDCWTGACCNGRSEHRADFTGPEDSCPEWEAAGKEQKL